jgi:hypothetical protein
MKIVVFIFSIPFFTTLHAQYLGSSGRGDVQLLKNAQGITGEDVNGLYIGSIGRGDIQLRKNAQSLTGEDVNVLYYGTTGRGDIQVQKNALGLNGEDVNILYYGGNGRGDIELLKNAQGLNGEDVNVLYNGGNGRGDIMTIKNTQGLNGEDVGIVYYGGTGRGDVFSEVTSGFADCALTFYWNGNVSDTWENPANWNCNQLPDITSNVVISSGLPHYPIVHNSTEIRRLECKTGSSVIVNPSVVLKVGQ